MLHLAIAYNRADILRDLLRRGADKELTNAEGMTPLTSALAARRQELASLLLADGSNACVYDDYGNGPLWYAVSDPKPNGPLIKALLKAGANPHRRNNSGLSPYEFVTRQGNAELRTVLDQHSQGGL